MLIMRSGSGNSTGTVIGDAMQGKRRSAPPGRAGGNAKGEYSRETATGFRARGVLRQNRHHHRTGAQDDRVERETLNLPCHIRIDVAKVKQAENR
jgi:hypothetical protein